MQRELHVYVDVNDNPVFVGRLWTRERSGRASASFTYDDAWRLRRGAFALSPALPLGPGLFHTSRPLFTAFTDSAPDSWGETVMRRYERLRAEQEERGLRTWSKVEYLIRVDDLTRLGALRFKYATGESFLTVQDKPVPPLVDLPVLLAASDRIDRGRGSNKDVEILLAPGTSLGGARPKANVRAKDGGLLVAKFPKQTDEWPVTQWEATTLELAKYAGVAVPEPFFLKTVRRKAVLFLGRFDRTGANARIPYMSALTALDADDHDTDRSYLELAEVLRQQGSMPETDLKQLWRRIVLNILVSNTDDHLRNHAFLRDANGWRLSPAFDMNPCPTDVKKRNHSLAINELEHGASLETALEVAPHFGLANKTEAISIASEVGEAVARWKEIAKVNKLSASDIDRMSSAFEHEDLRQALRGKIAKAPIVIAKKPKQKAKKRPSTSQRSKA